MPSFMMHQPGCFELKISSSDNKEIAQILRKYADQIEAAPSPIAPPVTRPVAKRLRPGRKKATPWKK